ncbi:MAG TPA: bifunctional UDP-N-acetylglucosamine diphosphorylase/glucosamine-1-phosphate N-acetyltransferase GlmU [Candidatus Dormibacteraeota bacterium]|nr:bifunctional UDP-N-acetylglucosamine diphosphorylase/glucosamine-1-phosphate N-acetyltransferase GlmU [Candidatus Dormibacteraeota bacterium]
MRANASAGSKRPVSSEPRVTVVVLAAGKGVRMNSRLPKVLHSVAGRPMLLWSMAAARALDPERTLVVTNPTHDGIQAALNGDVQTVSQAKQLGTGHALAQVTAAHRTSGPVVVLYADAPLLRGETLRALLAEHEKSHATVTLLTANLEHPTGYGRIVRARNGVFRDIVEEKDATDQQKEIREVNSGVYVFNGRELWPALLKLENNNRAGEYYLTDIVRLIKGKVHTLPVDDGDEILGINDRRQLAQAERVMRQRILDGLMTSGVTITDPATTFIDADVQVGRDTVVLPFSFISGESSIGADCIIGPFAQIRDSIIGDSCRIERAHLEKATLAQNVHVGPFSRLRTGSVLDEGVRVGTHAEIKNSHIGAGTAIAHFSAVLDSDVGAGANIGAGTITANFDGVDKHRTEIGDRAQVGSDTILVAPVRVGDDAYTAAGSVITADVPAGSLAIERSEQKVVPGWTERRRGRRKREVPT